MAECNQELLGTSVDEVSISKQECGTTPKNATYQQSGCAAYEIEEGDIDLGKQTVKNYACGRGKYQSYITTDAPELFEVKVGVMLKKCALDGLLVHNRLETLYAKVICCVGQSKSVGRVWVYPNMRPELIGGGKVVTRETPEAMIRTITFKSSQAKIELSKLSFATILDAEITSNVVNGGYICEDSCLAKCSTGYRMWAAGQRNGATAPYVVYQNALGQNVISSITASAATEFISDAVWTGQHVIVTYNNGSVAAPAAPSGYYYAPITDGVVGTWVKVQVSATLWISDIERVDDGVYQLVGSSGTVWQLTNPALGISAPQTSNSVTAQNLIDGGGCGSFRVATGFNGALITSQNGGASWASIPINFVVTAASPALPAGTAIGAVAVVGPSRYFIGTSNGRVFYTDDNKNFIEIFTGATAGVQINDIAVSDGGQSVWVAQNNGRLLTNVSGGQSFALDRDLGWQDVSQGAVAWRFGQYPTLPAAASIRRLALPECGDSFDAQNNIAAFGANGVGVDGMVLVGNTGI